MALTFWRGSTALVAAVVACAAAFFVATKSDPLPDSHWASLKALDIKRGETVFWMAGCSSCHAAKGAVGDAKLVLSGGLDLKTPFGVFHVPNISPDEKSGIGRWTLAQFGNAVKRGVGPNGEHLYPAFPYGSYSRMTDSDVVDLFGYLRTLPRSDNVVPPHDLSFPFNIRTLLGGWKLLYLSERARVELPGANDTVRRGQYIVEGPGHCGECHTPRNVVGGFKTDAWLAGAPNPEGQGTIPDITPGSKAIGAWSEADIATYLETGMTPDFDSVGGSMVEVQQNLAHLPASDREAIAAYLKAIPAR
jgi:mono/diheme cytochrome c family protein